MYENASLINVNLFSLLSHGIRIFFTLSLSIGPDVERFDCSSDVTLVQNDNLMSNYY